MGGPAWEATERYLANSPVFQAHRIATPLLLLCGTEDALLPQAEELYAALLRLGKPATLVRYRGEGHAPAAWSDEHYDDRWRRTLAWLDRYLRS
jgi:dipeptidyl aminopeptidase/acylaminoacyl peptidase